MGQKLRQIKVQVVNHVYYVGSMGTTAEVAEFLIKYTLLIIIMANLLINKLSMINLDETKGLGL